jgi:hypothetical protein
MQKKKIVVAGKRTVGPITMNPENGTSIRIKLFDETGIRVAFDHSTSP